MKSVEINFVSPSIAFLTSCAYFFEGQTDISQGFRQKALKPNFLSPKVAFLQQKILYSILGNKETMESEMEGLFQREMIIRSPSRHRGRSSVLTGELGRKKISFIELGMMSTKN